MPSPAKQPVFPGAALLPSLAPRPAQISGSISDFSSLSFPLPASSQKRGREPLMSLIQKRPKFLATAEIACGMVDRRRLTNYWREGQVWCRALTVFGPAIECPSGQSGSRRSFRPPASSGSVLQPTACCRASRARTSRSASRSPTRWKRSPRASGRPLRRSRPPPRAAGRVARRGRRGPLCEDLATIEKATPPATGSLPGRGPRSTASDRAVPGTSSIEHLRENLAAARLKIPSEMIADLDSIGEVLSGEGA